MHGAEVMKLVDHLAALGTAHHCLAIVATTREQRPVRRPRNGMDHLVLSARRTIAGKEPSAIGEKPPRRGAR